jgi:arginine utilization protein RocB
MTSEIFTRAKHLAVLMTSWPSVSETNDEANFAQRLGVELTGVDKVWVAPIPNDPWSRSNVFALRRGRSNTTIVLTGHFDTVPFDDYGAQVDLALQPEALLTAFKKLSLPPLARSDFESGDFLPGRGLLDMKAGLAAGIAAMEAYEGDASILFLAVSDEEVKSAGARAAIPQLKAAALEHNLDIALVINLDSISDQGDGSKGRIVTYGSIGKQLLCATVIGKQAHAGYPQDGVNAAYVMAELTRVFELAPELAEATGDEMAAPPSTLYFKDGKSGYNVTTPASAFAYWNTMQHRRAGSEVLEVAMELAEKAIQEAQRKIGHVIDLKRVSDFTLPSISTDNSLSLPDQTQNAMLELARFNRINEPTVILGFGSIPYPAVLLQDVSLRKTIAQAVGPFGLSEVNYFAGISDMSFFGETAGDLSVVAANTPIWGKGFTMPEPGGYPCINIGPWGRDYHTWLERVHVGYAFDVLPRVLLSVIDQVAKFKNG